MPMNDSPFERRPTGIEGLDRVLDGGLLNPGVYIVQGPPGAGKTILANHMCFNHASSGGRALYVTLLAESHARMLAHLRRLAFFNEELIPSSVYYIGGFRTLESAGLEALVTLIRGSIQKHKASLLVIDGWSAVQAAAPSEVALKKFVHELQTVAELTTCTVVLLTNAERKMGTTAEHTMVDGVLHLTDEVSDLRPLRHLQVTKLRGSAPLRGLHSVRISEVGFEVRPRLEAVFGHTRGNGAIVPGANKLAFGIERLDAMLRGGVRRASMTMCLGSSGSGKTLLGMQFLAEGLKRNEPGVYFSFYEHPDTILAKCQRIGIGGIREGVQRGIGRVVWHRPVEGIVDELGESLIESVRSLGATRLVIDGVQGFNLAADFRERMSNVYTAIAQELETLGVTTFYTSELRALFGPLIEEPINGLSAATQNIIVLRHVEHEARLIRALAILKVRDDDYDGSIREFQITDNGIRLGETTFSDGFRVLWGGGEQPRQSTTRQDNSGSLDSDR